MSHLVGNLEDRFFFASRLINNRNATIGTDTKLYMYVKFSVELQFIFIFFCPFCRLKGATNQPIIIETAVGSFSLQLNKGRRFILYFILLLLQLVLCRVSGRQRLSVFHSSFRMYILLACLHCFDRACDCFDRA